MASMQAFPAITDGEFSEACEALEQRSADKNSDTDWLSVKWTGKELLIRRTMKTFECGDGPTALGEGEGMAEDTFEELTDEDEEASIVRSNFAANIAKGASLVVDYSITLSPTYSVPVLWFSCRFGPENKPMTLDQIYEHLVPQQSSSSLRDIGVMGGISMAVSRIKPSISQPADLMQYHPISDLPSFFLHPCNTQDALSVLTKEQHLTPEEYLILWLGLIGSPVGLHIPSKLLSTGV
ncbi:hypothetical protein H2200_010603 [Cladophialophora chaetospira]|uniref:Ubiquitin-like-conjugating enzyme ATG10 n=1 Tax=Cladophialophora chaetospira TaxID=386627 RepID=A0AA39CEE0_9EURO|nr:hypothetical protein H2200_010603 [Cladophialophora chaetospira]